MQRPRPIYLFTDFGVTGPYVGQLHAAIYRHGYQGTIVDLQHDAPAFDPVASGILLGALVQYLPDDAVVLAVIDPGVGSERAALHLKRRGQCFIGPDNGLFAPLFDTADAVSRIDWMPTNLSASFHARDWFAPVACFAATATPIEESVVQLTACVGFNRAQRLAQVIYCDAFGNAMTGLPATELEGVTRLVVHGKEIQRARTFGDVPCGEVFWYENSLGLAEIAVNQGNATVVLGLSPGDPVTALR